jgi:molybdopterin-containing oxidoreductase family membrane subunit
MSEIAREAGAIRRPVGDPRSGQTVRSVSDKISSVVLTQKTPRGCSSASRSASLSLMTLFYTITWLLLKGTGIWGVNIPVGWGFDIVNFVWWIGIGHAGTLISAILLLLPADWRTSINPLRRGDDALRRRVRGLFPLLHMGRRGSRTGSRRTRTRWACGRSFAQPLVWDVFAVSTYATVSLLFWFVGLIPDLATLRDRSQSRVGKMAYGIFAMGWRGSAAHWSRYETAYLLLAALSTPLVVSVHTIVSFDFAVGISRAGTRRSSRPTSSPARFFSGFAMVMTLAIPLRKFYGLEDFVTMKHLDNMARVHARDRPHRGLRLHDGGLHGLVLGQRVRALMIWNRMTGPMPGRTGCSSSATSSRRSSCGSSASGRASRRCSRSRFVVNVGMWLERFVIVVTSLSRDFLPSSWGMYYPTKFDWSMYSRHDGLILDAVLPLHPYLPMISIFEMRTIVPEAAVRETEGEE